MDDLILRRAAISEFCANAGCDIQSCNYTCDAVRLLKDIPAVDAVPVVHGRWIHRGMDIPEHPNRCSVCNWGNRHIDRLVADFGYCPDCGAKMDLEV